MIKEFKAIWERNKDRKKALEELTYVYWMAYYNSVYDVYLTSEEKKKAIIEDIISDPKWKPDKIIEAAIQKYETLQQTFSMAFLESAKRGANKIRDFFENVDLNARNKSGGPIYKPVDITGAIIKSIEVLDALEKWQDKVKKEEELTDTRIKGGGKVGIFEDEVAAEWLNEK